MIFGLSLATTPVSAQVTTTYALTLEGAKEAAEAARAEAAANDWHVAIAIVDASGNLLYFERLPGTQPASVDIAIGKAQAAALFRRSTKVFEDGVNAGRTALLSLDIVPFEGGLPIFVKGEVVGAIGVTPQQDGQIAQAGAVAVTSAGRP